MNEVERSIVGRPKILVVAELAIAGLTLYLTLRVALGPDGLRTLKLRSARSAEKMCMRQAWVWAELADKAAKVYESGRAMV